MKTTAIRNRTIGAFISALAAAVLMVGLSPINYQGSKDRQTAIRSFRGIQVADGSESNGGKGGGKGGAKRSARA